MNRIGNNGKEVARFSRAWWINVGRSFFWISLVTVLIWMYADMRQTETEEVTATIKLTTGGDPDLVILAPGNVQVLERDVQIMFKVAGSRADLERFKKRLTEVKPVIPFDVSRDRNGAGKSLVLRTVDVVRDAPLLAKTGLSVTSASPETLVVNTDRLVRNELPVELVHSGAILEADPVINPAVAKIRVTETVWAKIQKMQPRPTLKTEILDLKQARPGEPVKKVLNLVAAVGEEKVILVTKQVTVEVQVAQHTDTKELSLTVAALAPPEWSEDNTWEKFALIRKDKLEWHPKITVTGPKTDLEKLEQNKKAVVAFVVLSERHLTPIETWEIEDIEIRFPRNLQVKLVGRTPRVSFRLEKRGETSGPP